MNPLDDFDRILALLHRAAFDDAHWSAATALIEEACGATGNVLTVGERSGAEINVYFNQLLHRGAPQQVSAQEYLEVYGAQDEGPPRLWERSAGELVHVPDLYTEAELKTSLAYNEGWRRTRMQKGLIARLDGLDGLSVIWAVGDPVATGGWQSAQLQLIESLLPHVRQFVRVRHALVGAEALGASLTSLLDNSRIGVLHVDRRGSVRAANDTALDILRSGEELSDRDGALHASLPANDGRLQKLLKRALPVFGRATPPAGGSMSIQRSVLRPPLELYVHPVDTGQAHFGGRWVAALVLVIDPESRPRIDPARVAMLLGLSPPESAVSALLAEGRPVREIAATLGYKESYVRWLLKQVYQKQGISGQIALVQRILTAYGFPRR